MTLRTHVTDLRTDVARVLRLPHLPPLELLRGGNCSKDFLPAHEFLACSRKDGPSLHHRQRRRSRERGANARCYKRHAISDHGGLRAQAASRLRTPRTRGGCPREASSREVEQRNSSHGRLRSAVRFIRVVREGWSLAHPYDEHNKNTAGSWLRRENSVPSNCPTSRVFNALRPALK